MMCSFPFDLFLLGCITLKPYDTYEKNPPHILDIAIIWEVGEELRCLIIPQMGPPPSPNDIWRSFSWSSS